ncbi:PanM family protein [Oceanimonas baumannii]|uniref:acetyl-CoA sensor PanZ family protein n=1 Tax=Oceanimonas baumannii TaxID=129578 RepID=UPI001D19385B|nr:acetyl-CoA sensor PanZ family protein [Oceanimonas baumannii]MCC4264354.1 PanM family protein [Oceanimonas baumannii]
MRLTVHRLTHLPEQHHHHARHILQDRSLPADQPFLLATFNDRAVALAWRQGEQITFFAVRDITRRRGVGSELLRQLKEDAKADGCTRLELSLSSVPAEQATGLADFFTTAGFNRNKGVLSCSL